MTIAKITGAGGLTFNLSFDPSVNNAPAGFITAIDSAAQYLADQLKNPITVNLNIGWGEVNSQPMSAGSLGSSAFFYAPTYTYAQVRSALSAKATSGDDASALASLGSTDPTGGGRFLLTTAEARALGLLSGSTGVDGYIGFSSGVNWAFDPNNRAVSGAYDLFGTATHEITEVLGRIALLGSTSGGISNGYSVLDLFRYSGAGTRDLVAGGYFSPDGGQTDLADFNSVAGGDAGDWANTALNDAFRAFGSSGAEYLVSEADLRVMDAIGWNLVQPYTGVFSSDGSTLNAGTAGKLVTSAGTWTFSSTAGSGGYLIQLNGQSVWSAAAVQLQVANGGKLYASNSLGQWSEWTGAGWASATLPSAPASSPPATSPLSQDGSILMAGAVGSLVTSAGTWTFGPATNFYGQNILLNGVSAGNGYSTELEVANNGNVYAGSNGQWWQWNGSGWIGSVAPLATSTTPTTNPAAVSPDGSILMAGAVGSLVTRAGAWTFGAVTNFYGQNILLNGVSAGNGYSTELEVANSGNVYAGSNGQWWQWNGSGWIGSAPPATSTTPTTIPAAVSPDGSIVMAGSGGSLVTSAGTWTFGAVTNFYGRNILLNGVSAGNGYSTELELANSGNVYAGSNGQWWLWNGSGWIGSAAPRLMTTASLAISPDGSILMAGSGGSLITSAGTWSFGTGANAYGNNILLNGVSAGNGYATELEVANNGNVYAGSGSSWWQWNGSGWVGSATPPISSITTTPTVSPDGSVLMAGSGGSLITNAGIWSFGTGANAYGNNILLNGVSAGNGYSMELEVANSGNVYAGSGSSWWQWNGSSWVGSAAPPITSTTTTPSTVSPDGSILMAGSGGSLITSAGIWSFGTGANAYGNNILLNGVSAGNGYSTELEVANNGNVYAGSGSSWWQWNGSGWVGSAAPPTSSTSTTPSTVSPDGSIMMAANGGSLVTSAGTWTFGAATNSYGHSILLNGVSAGNGYSTELEVANNGNVYAGTGGSWWLWNGSGWVGSTDPSAGSTSHILTVGPGRQYATISAAVGASQNGDTIQVQAGTYVNDFANINTNITLQAVGGMVNMVATGLIPNGKAILITNGDDTINGFSFSGAQVVDGNGAGIRYQSGNLILNNDYFHDNQEGILAASSPGGSITINNTEFAHNGDGSGFTHNLYVNAIDTLKIDGSYFHDAIVGHEIKSRASNTIITNSRIQDENGSASYSIDLPNGGNALIQNNVIEQGPLTQNPVIITTGEEGNVYANTSLQVLNNEILNDFLHNSALGVWNSTNATAQISGNQFYGLASSQVASGQYFLSNNTFLSTEPALVTTHPWA